MINKWVKFIFLASVQQISGKVKKGVFLAIKMNSHNLGPSELNHEIKMVLGPGWFNHTTYNP